MTPTSLKTHTQHMLAGGFKFPHHTFGSKLFVMSLITSEQALNSGQYIELFHLQPMSGQTTFWCKTLPHRSFCTVKLKHPSHVISKPHFLVKGDFKIHHLGTMSVCKNVFNRRHRKCWGHQSQ